MEQERITLIIIIITILVLVFAIAMIILFTIFMHKKNNLLADIKSLQDCIKNKFLEHTTE